MWMRRERLRSLRKQHRGKYITSIRATRSASFGSGDYRVKFDRGQIELPDFLLRVRHYCLLHLHFDDMNSSVPEEDLKSPIDSQTRYTPPKSQNRSKSPSAYRKPCDLCHAQNDVLIRCCIDDTSAWYFVCGRNCWKKVSGGVIDGSPDHPHYKYGGMWKNRHAGVSAKKPKPKQRVAIRDWHKYTTYVFNDKVMYEEKVWSCRRSHTSSEANVPGNGYNFWKEAG